MNLLEDLDLKDISEIKNNRYRYDYDLGSIDFVFLKKEMDFFDIHNEIWCENKTEFFITHLENDEIHICDSKTKPNRTDPIKTASIKSFKYGENTPKAKYYLELLKKKNIDTGDCLKEIKSFLDKRKRITIDKDLLENLEICRNKIINLLRDKEETEEIAQKIIDRCLFIRFLEDRAGLNDLKNILSNKKIDEKSKTIKLLALFDSYNKRLNGDIFEGGDIPKDIDVKIVNELDNIFGEVYIYQKTRQTTLFPYSFKSIPIVLISNIYEKFLSRDKRSKEGIVFTPENIVEYTINKILKERYILNKLKNKKLKILDPACGSGVFLIKFLEEIINRSKQRGEQLSLEDKTNIILNCIFGIDKNKDALRIAALSLYLKIIEDEKPDIIREKLFGDAEKHFMFPGLKKNENLVNDDSLFNKVFNGKKFDVIVGNPPWGYDFSIREKRIIEKKWLKVADYQSSQCFLLQIKKWMKKETVCGMVVNLSNFTNSKSGKFREKFIRTYYLKNFVNLSKVKNITFGSGSEPACVLLFLNRDYLIGKINNIESEVFNYKIEFITPELSRFSLLTRILSDGYISFITINELKRNDDLWHLYSLGYDIYLDLIDFLDDSKYRLNDFKRKFEVGMMKYWKGSGLTKEQYYQKYRRTVKASENHFPIVDSLKDAEPYFGKKAEEYFEYDNKHLDRARDINLFRGDKLIITRSWPIRAFIDSDVTLYDSNFFIFKLKNYPKDYLTLFESIINSTLSTFFFGVKYLLRKEGNYAKVNLEHLKNFPIPDLENKREIIKKIKELVESLKKSDYCKNITNREEILNEIDDLIFELYGLDYYSVQQIRHYAKLEKEKRRILVTPEDTQEYCEEFIDTFNPFIKVRFNINYNIGISDFFGTIVKFTISENEITGLFDNRGLDKFISIIESHEIQGYNRVKVFREEKIKFYDGNNLYIYKSNKPKDWTKYMAIRDANEEIELFFKKLGGG